MTRPAAAARRACATAGSPHPQDTRRTSSEVISCASTGPGQACPRRTHAGLLTNPEAASAASAGIARYEAQIARAIPADDADLRAAVISAVTLGITVSRHLIKSDAIATADPARIIQLLRPCMLSLAGPAGQDGPPD